MSAEIIAGLAIWTAAAAAWALVALLLIAEGRKGKDRRALDRAGM
jgi:hypothetical protein